MLAQTLSFLDSDDEEDDLSSQAMIPTQSSSRHLGNKLTTTKHDVSLANATAATGGPTGVVPFTWHQSTLAKDEARNKQSQDITTKVSWEEMLRMLQEAQTVSYIKSHIMSQ